MIHKVEIRDRRPGGRPGCQACGRRLEGRGRDLAIGYRRRKELQR